MVEDIFALSSTDRGCVGPMRGAGARGVIAAALVAAVGLTGMMGCDDAAARSQNQPAGAAKPAAQPSAKPADPAKKDDGKDAKSDPKAEPAKKPLETVGITVGPKTFKLDLAILPEVRMKGLGQRDKIADDGGMLFVFPDDQVRVQGFLMRDCPVDIDIIYLDGAGRVLSFYQMKAEKPRGADGKNEGKVGDTEMKEPGSYEYEKRLPKYSSRFPSQFVIELKGGTIPSLGLKEGQKIDADWAGLKKRAK